MSNGIFLLKDNGKVVDMRQQAFESEDFLQRLVADHPELLAGDLLDTDGVPRRFLLIAREMGLASQNDGGDRWAVDHLFVDQDAILTVVEVKRSSDTRIRREVVGQMLEYAAHAVAYLPIEKIRTRYEQTHPEPEQLLRCLLGEDRDVEYDVFWEQVQTNLLANKIRLVFLSDEIPPELRRIIEFLNSNMSSVEVLGIEIKQYANGETGLKTLVPRVIGHTAQAKRAQKSFDLGDIRESVVVDLVDASYKIVQYTSQTIKVFHSNSGVEEKAMPMLKRINNEKSLGISEEYAIGKPYNTRQFGAKVIQEVKRQG